MEEANFAITTDGAIELMDDAAVRRRRFSYRGLDVDELIIPPMTRHCTTLIWCLAPMEKAVVNGKINPLVYIKYRAIGYEDEARAKVREAFDRYHFPGDLR